MTDVTHGINDLDLETNDDATHNLLERRYRQAKLGVFNDLKSRLEKSGYTVEEFASWLKEQTLAPTTAAVLRENRKQVQGKNGTATTKNKTVNTSKPSDERQAAENFEDETASEEKTSNVKLPTTLRHGTKKHPQTE